MRANRGLNPAFVTSARRKRAEAEMAAMIADAQERVAALDRAARAEADAILDAAYAEARILIRSAQDVPDEPVKPIAEIIGEVGQEFSVAPSLIRAKGGIARVREARRVAIQRAVAERLDLTGSRIARIFNVDPTTVNAEVRRQREARHG